MAYSEGPITAQTLLVYEQIRAGRRTVNAIAAEIGRGRGTVAHRIAQLLRLGRIRVAATIAGGTKLYDIDPTKPAPALPEYVGMSFSALEAAWPCPIQEAHYAGRATD